MQIQKHQTQILPLDSFLMEVRAQHISNCTVNLHSANFCYSVPDLQTASPCYRLAFNCQSSSLPAAARHIHSSPNGAHLLSAAPAQLPGGSETRSSQVHEETRKKLVQHIDGFLCLQADARGDHPPHISLSRTLYTTAQQRQTLVSALQRHFKRQKRWVKLLR